jgi:hypothetical protein
MQRIKRFLSSVTGKKHHVEFFTALLSIPVLLTVILLNLSNLNASKPQTADTEKPNQIIISLPPLREETPIPTKAACKVGIGDVTITSPDEEEVVSDNPVNFTIRYDPGDYCAVVWSYRVNGGAWSEYDDKSIALYDLPSGTVRFDLRIKSVITGGGEATLSRRITYNSPNVSPTLQPSPTSQPTQPATGPTGSQ